MRLLLDTHIWLWSLLEPERLSKRVGAELKDAANELWLSPVSTVEVLLLASRGRIAVDEDAVDWLERALKQSPLHEAHLNHNVALETRRFTLKARDPADFLLVATARIFDLTLVTADKTLVRAKRCDVLPNR